MIQCNKFTLYKYYILTPTTIIYIYIFFFKALETMIISCEIVKVDLGMVDFETRMCIIAEA